MTNELKLKNITIDYLHDTKIGNNLLKAMNMLQNVEEVAYAYVSDDSSEELKQMRIGTVGAFAVLNKLITGRSIKDFSQDDWVEIASTVADQAILTDGQAYSVLVFTTYANYVDISVGVLQAKGLKEEKCNAIRALADRIRELGQDLADGNIKEVDYTEECLWILLEAMIKLLCAYSSLWVGETRGEFIESVSILAFEYGRYTLYKQEQEILDYYICSQYQLDEELEQKLAEFNRNMLEQQAVFEGLMKDAFAPDVMQRFRGSVEIAKNAGVVEEELLRTTAQVDGFFS